MREEIHSALNTVGRAVRRGMTVFREGDHWTSTPVRVDDVEHASSAKVAPRFYELMEGQARRGMLIRLENQHKDVRLIPED